MNKLAAALLSTLVLLAACGKKEPTPTSAPSTPAPTAEQPAAPAAGADASAPAEQAATDQAAIAAPAETVSEMDDTPPPTEQQAATTQPSLKLGGPASTTPTSARFKEGTNYQKIVPAQPTGVPAGKVEVAEVFWYGCGHCFALDPAIESWRAKGKPAYVEFTRVPAMWNDITRMHARVFYTAELLGKLDQLHSLIFRELHVSGNQLNTIDKIGAFFQQHGVSKEEFTKAFSSFAVESKLQRADLMNRRYRINSVPTVIVNGKYSTDVNTAGGESQLFGLIEELSAHEHGG